MNLNQSHRSVLALVLTAAFLITGRIFVWKPADKSPAMPEIELENPGEYIPAFSETLPLESTTTETTTTTIETTTTTTTEFSRFELIPPDYVVTYNGKTVAPTETASGQDSLLTTTSSETTTTTTTVAETTETEPPQTDSAAAAPAGYFNDALFIGDSRMVGIAMYAPIEGATNFGTVGLSTYKIAEAVSEVPDTKGQTFQQVLGAKKYGKVYIMLGINEIGMDFTTTMQNMDNIISQIRAAQPGAKIILMANLHVSAARHYSDPVVNNTKIDSFNALLAAKADNTTIFYLDVNPVFDDANGCLDAQYTSDNTHPYAKYYVTWSEWLQTKIF